MENLQTEVSGECWKQFGRGFIPVETKVLNVRRRGRRWMALEVASKSLLDDLEDHSSTEMLSVTSHRA